MVVWGTRINLRGYVNQFVIGFSVLNNIKFRLCEKMFCTPTIPNTTQMALHFVPYHVFTFGLCSNIY